jgi:hypothetical protein
MKMARLISLASLIAAIVAVSSGMALAQSTVPHEFRICTGDFALCAASTCTLDGNQITVNNASTTFNESKCTCPIFTGPAIADVLGGNMKGSCKPPSDNGGVWSLYELNTHIPQALNEWKKHGPKAAAPAFVCAGSNVQYSNCFSFACTRAGEINGVPVATCLCATQENLEAQPVSVGTQFITQAGQCDQSICTEFPIGAPFQIDDIPPPACFAIPEEGLTK